MLTLIGLLTIGSLVVLLLVGRTSPILPLIVVPLLGAGPSGSPEDSSKVPSRPPFPSGAQIVNAHHSLQEHKS